MLANSIKIILLAFINDGFTMTPSLSYILRYRVSSLVCYSSFTLSIIIVKEVEQALTKIKTILDSCVPQVRKLNSFLPEENRLEMFRLNVEIDSDGEDNFLESEDSKNSQTNNVHEEQTESLGT